VTAGRDGKLEELVRLSLLRVYGPVQLAGFLGLERWQLDRALADGLIRGPDIRNGKWSSAVAREAAARLKDIRAAVGGIPDLGAMRAADVLTRRLGIPVTGDGVTELARRGLLPVAAYYKGLAVYDRRALEAFTDASAATSRLHPLPAAPRRRRRAPGRSGDGGRRMNPAHDSGRLLTVLSLQSEGETPVNHHMADGPGLFEITNPHGQERTRRLTNVRRLAGTGRAPGSVLINAAAWLLVLIGAGALYVSFTAQRQYIFAARRQDAASIIEALLLDLLMMVFTLLALGLSRAGKPSRTERALILACAAASAYMNVAAADVASPRSVTAYVVAPLALAVVVDRVVAVIRRHVLADAEPSAWATLGRAAAVTARLAGLLMLYSLRFLLAAPETARGLRRAVLDAAPLPPVQVRKGHPYIRTDDRTGPWPVPAVDRDAVIARLADEIRDAIDAGERWQPDYPALMQATGRRRSWCEKAVRDARTAVFDTPENPDRSLS
jgi:hypothetical protein